MAENKSEKRGLGRGLSALIGDVSTQDAATSSDGGAKPADHIVPIENLHPNPDQPRRQFNKDDLEELAASIGEKGVLQPLIVRKNPNMPNSYEIVAGERRWRASQMAKLHELPVLIRDYTDDEVLEIAIIENVQRADLNPVEEAAGYRQLMDRFGHTQEKVAEALSKSRSHIANLLRLLQLPEDVLELLRDGKLSAGHARALITTDNPSEMAKIVVKKGLSVRETERLAKAPAKVKGEKPTPADAKDADTKALEDDLGAAIGMKVSIDHMAGKESGNISIQYKSLDQLDEICRILSAV
ncbi:MAG: ParB/RepB/Spo0J family partition protein [Marinosulfonomonas sp.]